MRRALTSTRLRRQVDSPWPGTPGPRASPGGRRDQPEATRSNVAALIPAYAEERHIRDVVTRTRRHLDVVLVVDDGSPDRTADEARAAGVAVLRHEHNAGKGAAIKTGLRALIDRPDVAFVLILDGDGQHRPEEIPRFLAVANEVRAAMVVGNRMGDVRTMPLVRLLTNRVMSWTVSGLIGQPVPDTQCGFRLFARPLFPRFAAMATSAFDAETEMLAIAARSGCAIAAARVSTVYDDQDSRISPWRDTVRFLRLMNRLTRTARTGESA